MGSWFRVWGAGLRVQTLGLVGVLKAAVRVPVL